MYRKQLEKQAALAESRTCARRLNPRYRSYYILNECQSDKCGKRISTKRYVGIAEGTQGNGQQLYLLFLGITRSKMQQRSLAIYGT